MATAAEIKPLKVKRANAKRALSAYENFLNKFSFETDFPTLEKRYQEIEKVRESFESNQLQLELLLDEADELEKYRSEFEEQYYKTYTIASNLLSQRAEQKQKSSEISCQKSSTLSQPNETTINPAEIATHDTLDTSITISSETQPTTTIQGVAHATGLPTIPLPKFDGKVSSWLGFYDLFNSLVNIDDSIPPVKKLFYLKSSLEGEAADVISSIESSAQNYNVAWNLLKDRYDDRKFIRDNYIKSLLDTPSISKEFPIRTFLNHLQKHLRALKNLGEPIESWDSLLIVLFREKFTNVLRERWDDSSNETRNPTVNQMISFLNRKAQLETTRTQPHANKTVDKPKVANQNQKSRVQQFYTATATKIHCVHCEGEHYVSSCNKFITLAPNERYEIAKKGGWCINCLRKNHRTTQCSSSTCRVCRQKHHSLLHFDKRNNEVADKQSTSSDPTSSANFHAKVSSEALLATAIVDIVNEQGKSKTCRVFLDAGSQAHFLTESIANFLKLKRKNVNIAVTGLDDVSLRVTHSTQAAVKSRVSEFKRSVEFLIVPRISEVMPSIQMDITNFEIPKNIVLADPEFHKPAGIDALIGVKLFYKLLSIGQITMKNHPDAVLQKTQLGWIVAGEISKRSSTRVISCHFSKNLSMSDVNLTRFWEMEEIPCNKILSPEEKACEEHYEAHTTRDASGRYIVRLPFNDQKMKLGESFTTAQRRLHSLENRFRKNASLQADYSAFLTEYEELNHMSRTDSNDKTNGFYLPHHAVIKQDSLTTKIRVVFDGSAKTSTGISVNDTLMIGPKVQDDLFVILLRYRQHLYVLAADAEKMYRQILVHPDDCVYQKILFRKNPHDPIETYVLNTLTYGTTPASYLSTRTFKKLAQDEGQLHPRAAIALQRDFYVDDLLTGAETRAEAETLREDLIELLKKGGFRLRKWASNDSSLVSELKEKSEIEHMSLDPNATIKTLGIKWKPRDDALCYSSNISTTQTITKRSILSQIAKLFDPLGLLGPVIVYAKIIMQMCWKCGVAWDESLPLEIHELWLAFQNQLKLIEVPQFPRCITVPNAADIQIHGFCDASEKAYGACIYLRSVDDQGRIFVRLICSKSRVAPISSLSLPRLELCGAVLLARLYSTLHQTLLLDISQTYLWSDSTITLHWINTQPYRLKTFVSNRVAEVQRLTSRCHWRHISSLDNPADHISRGQLPSEFLENYNWKSGPSWLLQSESCWPKGILDSIEIPELRISSEPIKCMHIFMNNINLLERYSSMRKLTRVVAYSRRFIHNLRIKDKGQLRLNELSAQELNESHSLIIKMVQSSEFSKEISDLGKNKPIHPRSKLISLSPFLDDNGILRVGGRLDRSNLPTSQKHPILLPARHHITRLILREEHIRLKHAGAQATLYSVRQTYWPLDGRNTTRRVIHNCLPCFRAKPRAANPKSGNLPEYRVTISRPFLKVGIDYCGPLFIKEKRYRNQKRLKVYVAIYVCMATKAVHLELVSDLTTEAFLASLRRFFARRGKSAEIYSDNATNFVGANRELQELFNSSPHQNSVKAYADAEKIIWHFIPPKSPHFGGIWEAAVKSFKNHLYRTVGDTLLTYEQLETYVIEIEAILNSRPISPLSSDPNDLLPLTPGHFLIGGPMMSYPDNEFTSISPNRLSAWQHAQQMKQHFWKRWYKEYLHHLISRRENKANNAYVKVGTLVLIREDNLPPLQWSVGRVTAVNPGEDGIIRVATVKTKLGEYKRCVKKLCPLPMDENNQFLLD